MLLPNIALSLLSQFSWDSQQGRDRATSGRNNFFLIGPILFLYYEESLVVSSNLNSKLFRFHCVRPTQHTVDSSADSHFLFWFCAKIRTWWHLLGLLFIKREFTFELDIWQFFSTQYTQTKERLNILSCYHLLLLVTRVYPKMKWYI